MSENPMMDLKKTACVIPSNFIYHPAVFTRPKKVRVNENALELYWKDARCEVQDPIMRSGLSYILGQIAGTECVVRGATPDSMKNIHFHIRFNSPIQAPNLFGEWITQHELIIPVEYCEVLDIGFLNAH